MKTEFSIRGNKGESEEVRKVEFWLETRPSGKLILCFNDGGDDGWNLLGITEDGKLERYGCLKDTFIGTRQIQDK